MTYPHLENAPEDHNSEEFMTYLRENNVVVAELSSWLVVENCKYHTPEEPHLTAFLKDKNLYTADIFELQNAFLQYDLLIKSPLRQSVKRFHVHLINKSNPK